MSEVLLARRCKLSFAEGSPTATEFRFDYGGPPVEIVEIGIHVLDYPGPFYLDRGDGEKTTNAPITPLSFLLTTPRGAFRTRSLAAADMKELNSDCDGAVDASYGLGFDLRKGASAPFLNSDTLLLDPGDSVVVRATRSIAQGGSVGKTAHWIEFFGEKELI